MAHLPGDTGHRILEALDNGPLPYSELRDIVRAGSKHFGAVLHAMKQGGLVERSEDLVGMTEPGASALDDLRLGLEVDTTDEPKPSVRLFPYERRAA